MEATKGMRVRNNGLPVKYLAFSLLLGSLAATSGAEPPPRSNQPRFDQLSPEVLALIGPTRLARDLPSPNEPIEVLRRYLRVSPYDALSATDYVRLMRDTVKRWPSSRFAHEGLANALLAEGGGNHGATKNDATTREAAAELLRAAELALADGQLKYQMPLAQLLKDIGDRESLVRFFEPAVAIAKRSGDPYTTCLAYADALAYFADPQADALFTCAINARPNGIFEPYERYSAHLLEKARYQDVLDLLSPQILAEAENLRGLFLDMRCRAAAALGHDPERSEDCERAKLYYPRGRATEGGATPDLDSKRVLGVEKVHSSGSDDCRFSAGCAHHPSDTARQFWCFKYHTWNMAEVMVAEAIGEPAGSQAAVAWTIRDRYTRQSTPACGAFPGSNLGCTSLCPDPGNTQMCQTQIRSCCTSHSGQFVINHVVPSYDMLSRARRVIDGELVDPVSGYAPPGATGCSLNSCDGTAYCNSYGSSYTYAPDGPLYFYANSATSYRCWGYQPGISTACAILASETCGNSPDGTGPPADNCYLRATRERLWNSGFTCLSGCGWNGSSLTMSGGGGVTRTATDTPAFKSGGMAIVVRAGLYSSGTGTAMRVRLVNVSGGVVYDFGSLPVASTTLANFEFRSTAFINGSTANRVWLTNEGTSTLTVSSITMRD